MKKILLALLLVAAGCSQLRDADADSALSVTINIKDGDQDISTRGTAADESFNESKIKTIDWFLYKDADYSEAFLTGSLSADAVATKTFSIDLTVDQFNSLGSASGVYVYAVVNLPTDVTISGTSLSAVKSTAVSADFTTSLQESFLMSGGTSVTPGATSLSLDVQRVAAKYSLSCTALASATDDEGVVWYSHKEAMQARLVNAVSNSTVDGTVPAKESRFSYKSASPRTYWYTYPHSWDNNSDTCSYFLVTLPVSKDSQSSSEIKNCYYKVYLSDTTAQSNTYYALSLDLKILGSFDIDEPTVITPDDADFYVHRWGGVSNHSGETTDCDISAFRFLEVDGYHTGKIYYMYNVNTLDIGYTSSDNCAVTLISATSGDFSQGSVVGTVDRSKEVSVSLTGSDIVVTHNLVNDISSSSLDYAPITITLKIAHSTGDSVADAANQVTITVVQYPAMYIEVDPSSGEDYLFVNANNTDTDYWNTVEGMDATSNNPNMYVINVSRFDSDDFTIGDPRSKTAKNASQIGFKSPSVQKDASGRTVEYYYGTETDGTTDNMIAPKYRICSAYGQLGNNTLTQTQAYYRCAAYQEDGYPAGRWRLPTTAELRFIGLLCAKGWIPPLFSDGMEYWSATGAFSYDEDDGSFDSYSYSSGSKLFSRCVYDEWYWESSDTPKVALSTFTWGDQQRK